jgi:hypothetical protein
MSIKARLECWKDAASTIQSVATVVALFVAGGWALHVFLELRQDRPRLAITHNIQHFRLPDGQILLSVEEKLSNIGPVSLDLKKGQIRIIQVLPVPDAVVGAAKTPNQLNDTPENPYVWPVLVWYPHPWDKEREFIEPGEVDTIRNYFLLAGSTQVVNVFSIVGNPAEDNKLGWRAITTYDLRADSGVQAGKPKEASPQQSLSGEIGKAP